MDSILVVEDNAINRDVAVLQLKALGWQTECAGNGAEAVEAVRDRTFALILMDVMMPELDGWETCRRIRDYEATVGRRTPIIGVSAWAAQDNKTKCLEAGMDDYLAKPYTRDDLKAVVDRWVTNVAK